MGCEDLDFLFHFIRDKYFDPVPEANSQAQSTLQTQDNITTKGTSQLQTCA
jgi:hypothetical protein